MTTTNYRSERGKNIPPLSRMHYFVYKIGHFFRTKNLLFFSRLVKIPYMFFEIVLGCSVPFSAKIGRGLILPHGWAGIHISREAKIGNDCLIMQQVTIGTNIDTAKINGKNYGAPLIGDHCFIGAGAKIIGLITIGFNCNIGANAVVVRDVPPNSTVYASSTVVVRSHLRPVSNPRT